MFQMLDMGIPGRAKNQKLIEIHTWNPRDYAQDKHRTVDDHPYGGGPGMVMRAEPLSKALQAAKKAAPTPATTIFLSPQGKTFNQEAAETFKHKGALILIAGRYEGVDERFIQTEIDEEWSIGDYVLSGGELPAMIMIDAITRLIPGALGDENSASQDSLSCGLLKYPQYTRPETFAGKTVPEVLLSGNHKLIEEWRLKQSLGRTSQRRPDLLDKKTLNKKELALLAQFKDENKPD